MLYNENIGYNDPSVTYIGTVYISVPGISNPIVIGNLTVVFPSLTSQDYSNATTIGFISYEFSPSGILTIEATQDQAQALVEANFVYINSASGEVSINNV